MIACQLDRVSVTYVSEPVFDDLSWKIHDDRIVGLVGPNGSGKSSLLKLINGELESESGFTLPRKGLKIGYLPQTIALEGDHSILQEVMAAHHELAAAEQELTAVEARLAQPEVYLNPSRLAQVLERQSQLLERFTELGGPGFAGQVRSVLTGLGFTPAELETLLVRNLSGGQKKLVGLAKLIITQPDLLLLDEPDNHLDLEAKAFLASFIRDFQGGVILVSHDRYLLDLIVDQIAELEDGKLTVYQGNYSEYAYEKQTQALRQQQLFQAQQKEIKRLEQAAARLLTWGRVYDNNKFIRRGQNILKRIERIEPLEKPTLERRNMQLSLGGWRGSQRVLQVQGLEKTFPPPERDGDPIVILDHISLTLRHGERVGLVGPNGSGKSLLAKIILGLKQPTAGEIILGPSVESGYYAQHHETLDPGRTLIEEVRQAVAISESRAVAFLSRFIFTYEQQRGKISSLSGGERSRLQLALLMLSQANFLVLDEPTNNLDIPSAEVLENALDDFQGTVLVISHDRYFLDRVVQRILVLEKGKLQKYSGNYSEMLKLKLTDDSN